MLQVSHNFEKSIQSGGVMYYRQTNKRTLVKIALLYAFYTTTLQYVH